MRIYAVYNYVGHRAQTWHVPDGVTSAFFECWGAAGGIPSKQANRGRKNETVGGSGPANIYFTNNPWHAGQLGVSYSNNAGYAAGHKSVNAGDEYHVFVGSNGGPGYSTIRLHSDGTHVSIGVRGGAGGWNGGGDGGAGAHTTQNLWDGSAHHVRYVQKTAPRTAKSGQYWYDTDAKIIRKCTSTYKDTSGAGHWTTVTRKHADLVGSSGGGGGGATDIRMNGTDLSDRILVAGGSGGAGGHWNRNGLGAWTLTQAPKTPNPPFGSDDKSTGHSGVDSTYAATVDYFKGGWGRGGLGGGTSPSPSVVAATSNGHATVGESGGNATGRHAVGVAVTAWGVAGHGGTATVGGARGYSGASSGSLGRGGAGMKATALTPDTHWPDDLSAGGGGGGGGYYGGGGGGEGFTVGGDSNTFAGGGGGGSNFASQVFDDYTLVGGARPPVATSNAHSPEHGATGHGGFARITYSKPPQVQWVSAPRAVAEGIEFGATFRYTPAISGGVGIARYAVGTGASTDSFPTSQSTYVVPSSSTDTIFSHTFTAPAAGDTVAIFVQVTDTDGDASPWLKRVVTGLTASQSDPVTITSPSSGAQFEDTATVTWSVGTQTPEVAYRLQLTGTDLSTGQARQVAYVGWNRGGSRVNFATDPGFTGTSVWSSDTNVDMVSETSHPGVSGHNGRVDWTLADDFTAEQHTTSWTNLIPGLPYHVTLNVASDASDDLRAVVLEVWDDSGMLNAGSTDFLGVTAGNYAALDVPFTPTSPDVYLVLKPTGSQPTTTLGSWDFSDNTTDGFSAGTVDTTNPNSGDYCLALTGTTPATLDITAALTAGPGYYVAQAWGYAPAAADADVSLSVSGDVLDSPVTGTDLTRDDYVLLRVPFRWNGSSAVTLSLGANAAGSSTFNYDDISVSTIIGDPSFELASWDFSDGTPDDFDAEEDGVSSVDVGLNLEQAPALVVTGPAGGGAAATADLTPYLLDAGYYQINATGLVASAAASDAQIGVSGTGILLSPLTASSATRDVETALSLTFFWDGIGTCNFDLYADDQTATFSDLSVWATDSGHGPVGTTDSGQTTYTADLLVEMAYADAGETGYFDSTHVNGQTGTVSLDASGASVLTGTDVTSGSISYSGVPLADGLLLLDTLSVSSLLAGYLGAGTTEPLTINPSVPPTPNVTLTVDSDAGLVNLAVDANDTGATNPTVSFDIFRDGTRIATGLLPDATTRLATFTDAPSIRTAHAYVVRAFDSIGGYVDVD